MHEHTSEGVQGVAGGFAGQYRAIMDERPPWIMHDTDVVHATPGCNPVAIGAYTVMENVQRMTRLSG